MVLANPTYMHTVYDHMYGDFPAKNTVYTCVCVVLVYIGIYAWFWTRPYLCGEWCFTGCSFLLSFFALS